MNAKARVKAQFERQARHYTVSTVHAGGESLDRLVELAEPRPDDLALDIATGTGFTACAVAPFVRRVIASDLTPAMLYETRALTARRGLSNVIAQYADAEALPFRDGVFDLVTCRTAPHHFSDPVLFLRETCRVLKPGGRLVVSDTCSPEDDDGDGWMHRLEVLRDATHVRNYRPAEWQTMVSQTGLAWEAGETGLRQSMSFTEWVARSGTAPEVIEELRRMILNASPALRETFRIEDEADDIRFAWPYVVFRARKAVTSDEQIHGSGKVDQCHQ